MGVNQLLLYQELFYNKYDMKSIKSSFFYKRLAALVHRITVKFNPRYEAIRCYKNIFGVSPNLDNPQDLIEKTYWLQLNTDTSLWTKCADKYRMREYVDECKLGHLLPQLYGVWAKVEDINFDLLPNAFVLKTNHATETCIIVKDKNSLNIDQTRKILEQWLSIKFGYSGVQLHYLKIKPLIIAEELLVADKEQLVISPYSLIDYKIFCCDGIPQCVWVAYNRTHEHGVDMNLYDMDWVSHPEWTVDMPFYHYKDVEIPKPACFDDLIEYCKKLAKPFPEVRLDFYVINNKPYIGELTFTSGYGFFTKEFYEYLGSKVDISKL